MAMPVEHRAGLVPFAEKLDLPTTSATRAGGRWRSDPTRY
jgi:hypothetical protein